MPPLSLACVLVLCAPVFAQGTAEPPADKSAYHLFNPTPRALMRDMSTDRPDTTESAYTVDAGHFQLEMSLVDFTYDRMDGVTTRTLGVAPMLLKAGLLNNVDLQVGLDPYTRESVTEDGDREIAEGFGDTLVRLKINLWGNDGGATAFALMPFVMFPTATDGLGSGAIEGGLIAPLAVELPGGFSLGVMAEVDFIRSAADDRYVVDLVHTATVGREIATVCERPLGGYIEYAGFLNLNGDEDYRGYGNAGLTLGLSEDVQLDWGGRVGLTRAAEDVGVFAGVSVRF